MLVIDDGYLGENLKRDDEDKERFGTEGTLAYEGVIHPDAIEEIWFLSRGRMLSALPSS